MPEYPERNLMLFILVESVCTNALILWALEK